MDKDSVRERRRQKILQSKTKRLDYLIGRTDTPTLSPEEETQRGLDNFTSSTKITRDPIAQAVLSNEMTNSQSASIETEEGKGEEVIPYALRVLIILLASSIIFLLEGSLFLQFGYISFVWIMLELCCWKLSSWFTSRSRSSPQRKPNMLEQIEGALNLLPILVEDAKWMTVAFVIVQGVRYVLNMES